MSERPVLTPGVAPAPSCWRRPRSFSCKLANSAMTVALTLSSKPVSSLGGSEGTGSALEEAARRRLPALGVWERLFTIRRLWLEDEKITIPV